MKLRLRSKLLLTAAIGLAFGAMAAHAQLTVNVSQQATFSPFVGGTNNNVTNNGVLNASSVITTGTSAGSPFAITYTPFLGSSTVTLGSSASSTLETASLLFSSPSQPVNYFSSLGMEIKTDFDSDGVFDLTQDYTLNLTPFVSPNGLTGISYSIVPDQFFGKVTINGQDYAYSSVVSNSTGTLFDGSNTTAAVQFQFLATPVPEPSTYALAGIGAIGGIVALRRRRAAAKATALVA